MIEVWFWLLLGGVWILIASWQDLKNREVLNWLSFSLIAFALGFRFFYSLFNSSNTVNFMFLYQGLIGLGIFFILGNLLYYGRVFAGGDAKLMIALGSVLPLTSDFIVNVKGFVLFFIIFLFSGMVYGMIWSLVLTFKHFGNFKIESKRLFWKNKKVIFLVMIMGLVFMLIGFIEEIFFIIGSFIFLIPYVFVYAKAIDNSCMIKNIKTRELTEGDWLYKDVKISRNKIIKANWEGLTLKEIVLLREKKKQVLIRHGIPFVPVFLIAFLVFVYVWFSYGIEFINWF